MKAFQELTNIPGNHRVTELDINSDFPPNETARLVALVFSQWAGVEVRLVRVAAAVIGANAGPISSLIHEIRSVRTRLNAVKNVSKRVLENASPDHRLVVQVVDRIGQAATLRNSLAHSPWALTPTLPDALLLVDSGHLVDRFSSAMQGRLALWRIARMVEAEKTPFAADAELVSHGPNLLDTFDEGQVTVVAERDLTRLSYGLEWLLKCLMKLETILLGETPSTSERVREARAEVRRQLARLAELTTGSLDEELGIHRL